MEVEALYTIPIEEQLSQISACNPGRVFEKPNTYGSTSHHPNNTVAANSLQLHPT